MAVASHDDNAVDTFKQHLLEVGQFDNLPREEVERLGRAVQRGKAKGATVAERDEAAKAAKTLVEHNARFVVTYIKKHWPYPQVMQDLISAGHIGLIQAVWGFDPDYKKKDGTSYSITTYAAFWIKQAVLNELYARRLIKIPPHVVEQERVLKRIIERFTQDNGRAPLIEEIQEELAAYLRARFEKKYNRAPSSEAELDEFAMNKSLKMDAQSIQRVLNLPDTVAFETQVDSSGNELGDLLAAPVVETTDIDHQELVRLLQDKLDHLRDGVLIRKIIEARIGLLTGTPMRLREVGAEIGKVRERVRQLEAEGLETLGPNVKRAILGLLPNEEGE